MSTRSILTAMDVAMVAAGLGGLAVFSALVFASFIR